MSSANKGRGLFVRIFLNFRDSFNVLKTGSAIGGSKGTLVGQDPYGNKYFEIAADPRQVVFWWEGYCSNVCCGFPAEGGVLVYILCFLRRGRRRPQRWYQAIETMKKDIVGRDVYAGFDTNLPSEWESWLRHRRDEAPSEEQVTHRIIGIHVQLGSVNAF